MQEYEVFNFDDDVNQNVVLITSTEDLYFLQDDIFDTLNKRNGECFTVLVDLFLRNGYSFNRFVSLNYNGKEQCKQLIINPREVPEYIKAEINGYLKSNSDLLENSSLSQKTLDFIKAQ